MIKAVQRGDLYALSFRYDPMLVHYMHQIPGAAWEPSQKLWMIHKNQLGTFLRLIKGTVYDNQTEIYSDEDINVNATVDSTDKAEIPDIDISDIDIYVKDGEHLFQHQIDFLKWAKARGRKGFILADDPGCISGDAIIKVNIDRGGQQIRMYELYRKFHRLPSENSASRPNPNHTPAFKARCLNYDKQIFELHTIKDVLDRGERPVYRLVLSDGKSLKATADHEILTDHGFVELQNLSVGDTVVTNGEMHCIACGSTDHVCTTVYGKFYGYCRKCMYRLRDGSKYKGDEEGVYITKDGYIGLVGRKYRNHPNYRKGSVLEHHYVMSQHIGRGIAPDEVVHHINGIKTDNRIENLQLMSKSEHSKLHSAEFASHLQKDCINRGNLIIVTPKSSTVQSIEYAGVEHVYDIVMEDPYRNFIANGIVVHNCGKTLEVINHALYMRKTAGYKHCLILCCVNVAKFSWQSDIAKHTPERSHIIGSKRLRNGKMRYNGSGVDKLSDLAERKTHSGDDLPYFLIMNIESLRLEKGAIVKQIIDMVNSGEINMIVLDECHKNMSPKSQQGKAVLEIKKKTGGAAQWISVTGTPITSKPTDVYTPLKLIDAHTFKNFWLWQQYFCVFGGYDDHEILAYRNIPELKAMLQGNMIRRLKEDVLDLPEKIRMTEYVELTPYQERMYDDIKADMLQHENEIVTSLNPLTKFLRLRQACGFPEYLDAELQVDNKYLNFNSKMRRCIELIDEIIERGEKVVVFSQWVTPLRTLYRLISKRCKVACYTGTMDEALKEQHKKAFIENPEVKVLIGTIGAIGTSSTLVVANNLIFIDEPWNPSDRLQAEDRIHRIGATKSANIYTIIAKDTVDDSVHTILEDKELISKYIVDGVIDIRKNPELFKQLLS